MLSVKVNRNKDFKIAMVPPNAAQELTACKMQIGDPPLARNETSVLNKVDLKRKIVNQVFLRALNANS